MEEGIAGKRTVSIIDTVNVGTVRFEDLIRAYVQTLALPAGFDADNCVSHYVVCDAGLRIKLSVETTSSEELR